MKKSDVKKKKYVNKTKNQTKALFIRELKTNLATIALGIPQTDRGGAQKYCIRT